MEHLLLRAVKNSLDRDLVENAIFWGERLYAHQSNALHANWLARAYLRGHKIRQARALLENYVDLQVKSSIALLVEQQDKKQLMQHNRLLLSKCCFQLGEIRMADRVLCLHDSMLPVFPNADSFYLLGQIAVMLKQYPRAIRCFREALHHDPLLWSAFESLSALGGNINPEELIASGKVNQNLFPLELDASTPHQEKERGLCTPSTGTSSSSQLFAGSGQTGVPATPMSRDASVHPTRMETPANKKGTQLFSTLSAGVEDAHGINNPFATPMSVSVQRPMQTPTAMTGEFQPDHGQRQLPLATPSPANVETAPPVLFRAPRKSRIRNRKTIEEDVTPSHRNAGNHAPRLLFHGTTSTSMDSSLFKNQSEGMKTPVSHAAPITPAAPIAKREMKKSTQMVSRPALPNNESVSHKQDLLLLSQQCGCVLHYIHNHQYKEALDAVEKLPFQQKESGWVLFQCAKAHVGLSQFYKAKQLFEKMRRNEPNRIEGMALYSTVLWHLHESKQLSCLAHELAEDFKNSPETWCVVGNCFSLLREHSSAVKFFRRALQIDAQFTYAYTLSGHEFIAQDEMDKALVCFRNAVYADPRHYKAWHGLGLIYFHRQKYDLAKYHFERALQINPQSAVLHYYLGMVLHAQNSSALALQELQIACELDEKLSSARLKMAAVLATMDRCKEALQYLEELRDLTPKEAPIYYMLGCVHHKLGNRAMSLMNLNTAHDLDDRHRQEIQNVISKVLDGSDDIQNFELPPE